jgi:hypothetical protein
LYVLFSVHRLVTAKGFTPEGQLLGHALYHCRLFFVES